MAVAESGAIEDGIFYAFGATPGYEFLDLDRFREFLTLTSKEDLSGLFVKHSELILDCLVTAHEREHFVQYQTTVFGGLMWRLFQCLRVDIAHLGAMVDRSGSLDGVAVPLHVWVKEHGRSHFYDHAPPGEDRSRSVGSVVGMLDEAEEIEQLLEFFDLMMGPLTHAAEKLATINAGYRRLAVRSGLFSVPGVELVTGQLGGASESYSTAEVMEAGARLAELAVLQRSGADAVQIADWQKRHVHGVYKRALSALLAPPTLDVKILKAVVDTALCGPVDLICPELHEPSRPLVDIHPGARFERLLVALRDTDVSTYRRTSNLATVALLDVLCAKAKLPRLSKTLRYASQATFQKDANWGGMTAPKTFPTQLDFIEHMQKFTNTGITSNFLTSYEHILLTSLERRLFLPCSFMEPAGAGTGLMPLIELFVDKCALNPIPGEEMPKLGTTPDQPGLHETAFIHLLEQVFCLRAVGIGNLAQLMSFAEKLKARIEEDLDVAGSKQLNSKGLLEIAARSLPSSITRLLNESHELPFDLLETPVQRFSASGDWSAQFIEPRAPYTPDEIRALAYLPLLFHLAAAAGGKRPASAIFASFLQKKKAHKSGLLREICSLIAEMGPTAYFESAPEIAQIMSIAGYMQQLLARELPPDEYRLTVNELLGLAVDTAVASSKKFLIIAQISQEQREILARIAEIYKLDLAELPPDKKAKLRRGWHLSVARET